MSCPLDFFFFFLKQLLTRTRSCAVEPLKNTCSSPCLLQNSCLYLPAKTLLLFVASHVWQEGGGESGTDGRGQGAGGGAEGGGGGCHFKPAADTSARFGRSQRADPNDYLFCGKIEGEFTDKIKMHILHL